MPSPLKQINSKQKYPLLQKPTRQHVLNQMDGILTLQYWQIKKWIGSIVWTKTLAQTTFSI